ncbi:MAG: transposase [Roseiflexus sp.]|nr:transposase [Roseiflexus sp.]
MTATIHAHLADRSLLPAEPMLDAGDVAAETQVTRQQRRAVDEVGPVLRDNRWQARQPDGRDSRGCAIDWDAQRVTCPAGKTSVRWMPGAADQGAGQEVIAIQFHPDDCRGGPLRARRTRAKTGAADDAAPLARPAEARHTAWRRHVTEAFKQRAARRAGMEGGRSHGVRAFGLRAARSRGLAKTRVHHILIAVAMNLVRVVAWGHDILRAATRQSSFARLVASCG